MSNADRELLELAAKAAGIEILKWGKTDGAFTHKAESWSPLTSDGDALRLAVKIRTTLICTLNHTACDVLGTDEWVSVEATDDAAARRAIVLAAAQIGRAMP